MTVQKTLFKSKEVNSHEFRGYSYATELFDASIGITDKFHRLQVMYYMLRSRNYKIKVEKILSVNHSENEDLTND